MDGMNVLVHTRSSVREWRYGERGGGSICERIDAVSVFLFPLSFSPGGMSHITLRLEAGIQDEMRTMRCEIPNLSEEIHYGR